MFLTRKEIYLSAETDASLAVHNIRIRLTAYINLDTRRFIILCLRNQKVIQLHTELSESVYALAIELAKEGNDILIIDCDEEKVAELREYTENAFVVKNIDKKSLQSTGIQNCDVAVVCIGEQLDTSILTTLNLVSMGIPHVISKAKSAEHGEILEKLGAEVVYPERDMAIRLANRLITSSVIDFVQLSEQINVSKMKIPANAIGKSVIDLNLRSRFNLNIIAIEKSGVVSNTVDPHYTFQKDDVLYICGGRDSLTQFSDWLYK